MWVQVNGKRMSHTKLADFVGKGIGYLHISNKWIKPPFNNPFDEDK